MKVAGVILAICAVLVGFKLGVKPEWWLAKVGAYLALTWLVILACQKAWKHRNDRDEWW